MSHCSLVFTHTLCVDGLSLCDCSFTTGCAPWQDPRQAPGCTTHAAVLLLVLLLLLLLRRLLPLRLTLVVVSCQRVWSLL